MAKLAYKAMDDKLAKDIRVIDISTISIIADYFLICDGKNVNQIQAIADNVEDSLAKAGYIPKSIEGRNNTSWILLDYGDIIVHVFNSEDRGFYDLERIWKDGKPVDIETI
ncbi:MAG: ribosome silencing factor [Lachnospiraceae bacterium]|nr:ribosome silencing factor [Lachnospiraceae bacterium]